MVAFAAKENNMSNMRLNRLVKSKNMDTKLSIREIEEMIISNEVSLRNEIAIPNLSWGMLPYEADIVVINKTGYMREYEIKRSLQDLKADFKKKCYHDAEQVYQFFYVLPLSIKEKALELFRAHQTDDAYIKAFGKSTEYHEALPAVIFYSDEGYIAERPRFNGHLCGNHRKLFLEEKLTITRLLSIRYWNLRLNKHEKD